jgi:hypothetical protein
LGRKEKNKAENQGNLSHHPNSFSLRHTMNRIQNYPLYYSAKNMPGVERGTIFWGEK